MVICKYLSFVYTKNLAGRRYLFSHPKYEAGDIFAAWPVVNTCFPSQNMKSQIQLRPDQLQLLVLCEQLGLASCRRLFSYPKYKAKYIIVTGRLAYIRGLASSRYLFCYPKYKARYVLITNRLQEIQAQKPSRS